MNTKIRVAVLLGGNSNEKEISLDSGRNIVYKLDPNKYTAIPIFLTSTLELCIINTALLVRNSTKEIEEAIQPLPKIRWDDLPSIADFVFIGLHGGLGENGGIQGALEMLNMPYNGSSVLASALCMDKFKTAQFLKSQGFQVPASLLINSQDWHNNTSETIALINKTFTLPIIVKPHNDGCSVMVQKVTQSDQIVSSLNTIFSHNKDFALVEEYITGMELTVGVLGNDTVKALPPSQAIATSAILSIEEKFLPGAGENQTPAPLPTETLAFVQRTIEKAYQALGCKGYARIDCFYQTAEQSPTNTERVVIIEVNTLPGLTPATCIFHQAAEIGLRPMEFIGRIVELGLQEHTQSAMHKTTDASTMKMHAL